MSRNCILPCSTNLSSKFYNNYVAIAGWLNSHSTVRKVALIAIFVLGMAAALTNAIYFAPAVGIGLLAKVVITLSWGMVGAWLGFGIGICMYGKTPPELTT